MGMTTVMVIMGMLFIMGMRMSVMIIAVMVMMPVSMLMIVPVVMVVDMLMGVVMVVMVMGMLVDMLHMMQLMLGMPLVQIRLRMTNHYTQHIGLIRQVPGTGSIADAVHDHGRQGHEEAGGCSRDDACACRCRQLHSQAAFGNGDAPHHLQGGRSRHWVKAMVDADGARA